MAASNAENFNPIINGRTMRPPLRMIHIFSVAKRSFKRSNPPLFPKLELRGCENGERYVLCTSVPDPILQACPDEGRGDTRLDDNDGWIATIDLLTPGNFSMDPYAGLSNPTYFANLSGMNLVCEGVFPSLNEVPTEEELKKAEDARNKRYHYLVTEARKLAAKSRVALNEFLDTNPDTHIAMDSLSLEADWHTKLEFKASCPNCGDQVKQGVAFHMSSLGMICILDAEKAFKAGAISRERYEDLITEPGAAPKKVK